MQDFIGKICMIRTYSAGVHYGKLLKKEGKEIILENSRRVHYWDGAASLSQLAVEGSKEIDHCRIAIEIPEIQLTEVIEIIPMSEAAIENLKRNEWKI